MTGVLNLKPSDIVAIAVQGDGSCLIFSHDTSGSRATLKEALEAASEMAADTNRSVLIINQSIPELRRFLRER